MYEEKATSAQLGLLRKKGVAESQLTDLTKRQASNLIDQIFAAEDQIQGKGPELKTQLTTAGLLQASDEIMQHIDSAAIYGKLSEAAKMEAFKALVDAYSRTGNPMKISDSRRHR